MRLLIMKNQEQIPERLKSSYPNCYFKCTQTLVLVPSSKIWNPTKPFKNSIQNDMVSTPTCAEAAYYYNQANITLKYL